LAHGVLHTPGGRALRLLDDADHTVELKRLLLTGLGRTLERLSVPLRTPAEVETLASILAAGVLPSLQHLELMMHTRESDPFPAGLRLPALTHLYVVEAHDRVAASLAAALKRREFPALQSVALQGSVIDQGRLIRLLRALPRPSLKVLDLQGTRVNDAVGAELAKMLPTLPHLKVLKLGETQLPPSAAEAISRLMRNAKLQLLPNDTLPPPLVRIIRARLGGHLIE
jgi:hypothetical protein